MITLIQRASLACVLSLCACSSTSTAPAAPVPSATPAPASDELSSRFPKPKSRLEIEATDNGVALEQLLKRVSQSTGVVYSYDYGTLSELQLANVHLSAPAVIEPAQVYPWLESLLVQHGFLLGSPTHAQPPMVHVLSLTGRHSSNEITPLQVPTDGIAFCREHPAVLVVMDVVLPHLDVRTLGNSLRGITSDPTGGQGIMPVGNTNSIVLTGPGGNVANLFDLLMRVDLAAAQGVDQRDALATEAAKHRGQ